MVMNVYVYGIIKIEIVWASLWRPVIPWAAISGLTGKIKNIWEIFDILRAIYCEGLDKL